MKTIASLSREVAAILKEDILTNEKNRFCSMDLCVEILEVCDKTHDDFMRETLRSWIVKVQNKFQG